MPSLAETTAMMAKLRRQFPAGTAPASKGDGRLSPTDFAPNPGSLRMLSYAPARLKPLAPLVVILHGCTQSAAGFAAASGWLTLADQHGFAVLAPEQTAANNPNRCFNWFEPGDTARGDGEAASIRAMVAHAVRKHGLDPRRIFITGLSAGGAMTAAMLAAYPDVFAGGAIIAGLPYGVAHNAASALNAMYAGQTLGAAELGQRVRSASPAGMAPPRVSIWHGDADATVKASNARASEQQWLSVHGLSGAPDRTETLGARTRTSWLSPETGQVLIESNLLHGMGHGAPLSTKGAGGLGAVAPFMLETGVSSSLEIARFWDIAPPAAASTEPKAYRPLETGVEAPQRRSTATLGDQVLAAVGQHVSQDVRDVISRALKAAGLHR